MKLKACRNGIQAQLGVMRFMELMEKSHPFSLVKGKKYPAYLRNKVIHTGCLGRVEVIWSLDIYIALWKIWYTQPKESFLGNLWIHLMLYFWRVKYWNDNYMFCILEGQLMGCHSFSSSSLSWQRRQTRGVGDWRLLSRGWRKLMYKQAVFLLEPLVFLIIESLEGPFLQEAFWDWLYLALITPTGLCISFWCFIHQIFMKA